jgi:transcriptional regulator with GAF, ATPase, and Fis domain
MTVEIPGTLQPNIAGVKLPDFAVGCSEEWTALVRRVQRVAEIPTTVLVRGETGAGKEIVAKLIVALGSRSDRPFISLNCAALTESLLESELFGHVRGAFTSATAQRKGLFEEASGGTLFLDEIGAVPIASQAKLLRVLEEGRIRRVGDNRFVPGGHANPGGHESRSRGRDRPPRVPRRPLLSIVGRDAELPPLRSRRADIPLLAAHFLERLEGRGFPARRLSRKALDFLMRYPFPGNVRELKHAIEQAVIFSTDEELTPADFASLAARAELLQEETSSSLRVAPAGTQSGPPCRTIEEISEAEIVDALRQTRDNRLEAAKLLGISRSSLYRILRRTSLLDSSRRLEIE